MHSRVAPFRYRTYVWGLFAGGMITLAFSSQVMTGPEFAFREDSYLLLWASMIVMAALSPLPLPWARTTASLVTALDLAALLLFGPAAACWVGVLSRLVAAATQRRDPLLSGILAMGQIVFALTASGLVYTQLGGTYGAELTVSLAQTIPLVAAVTAYLLVKGLIGGLANAMAAEARRGSAFVTWFVENLPGDLLLLPIGPLLALTQIRIGPVGVALFLLPLLLARYSFILWAQTKVAHLNMVRVLMAAVDAADPFTRDHSYRVSRMCLSLGRHLGMRPAALEELEFAGLLHDIGRTAIQRDILIKRGKLTEQEMQLLQVHPRIGADLMAGERYFSGAAEIVLCHHEQPDGRGYPRGLAGDAVPLGSRIIMVVAAFDAMTSDRPYRRGLSPEEAFEELLAHSGTQFYPDVVEGLIQLYAGGSLFTEFEETHLDRYRNGHEHSRAIESHLKAMNGQGVVPEKAGLSASARGKPLLSLPVIELPAAEPEAIRVEKTIPLKAKGSWSLAVAGMSDIGCKRKNNEDAFNVFQLEDSAHGCLLVLADGMGGAAAGEVASQLTVETVGEVYRQKKLRGQARDALAQAFKSANRAVHTKAAGDSRLEGMGTTCTAVSIVGLDLTLGHVGDSRAYLIRRGAIEQISQDHTLAGEMARVSGERGAAVPAMSSNMLTRCIGAQPDVQVDLSPKPIHLPDGATLVLCSDGLSNVVEPEEILDLATAHAPGEACESMVELARARGGPDNITVIVAQLQNA